MGALIVVEPMAVAGIAATRGTGVANLLTPDPKEVWADSQSGGIAYITLDLGRPRAIDTVLLGFVRPPAPEAFLTVSGGVSGNVEWYAREGPLRVPSFAGDADPPARTHGLWHGPERVARYVLLHVGQPAGAEPLTAGAVVVGRSIGEAHEWGAGRRMIDTGTATPLPGGGFATVRGARKKAFSWTCGDLPAADVDRLERIADELGETRPGLVIEDPAATAGLHGRIHYGRFRWNANERRDPRRWRWEIGIEQWV